MKAESPEGLLLIGMKRRRPAISEVTGSLIMIAITLVAGAAVFGYVNGLSGTSSSAVGASAANNVNFLNEREVIVAASMTSPASGCKTLPCADVYVYNNGAINPEYMASVEVTETSNPSAGVCLINVPPSSRTPIPTQTVVTLLVDLNSCGNPFSFSSGSSYNFEVTGQFGSTNQFTVGF